MSFGLPVVAPRVGCLAEVLDDEGAVLYDREHPDALAAALERTVRLGKKLSAMGRHNREKVKPWGWDYVAGETMKVYSDRS
jgi:glycosyltransferase involved in cell wall biosynthesis